ncbi:hypothetical protein FOZ62_023781 [Perkinsus olseni]|uniref:Uncharacterized protein n=1 Tax=Perkinsus olseni TaxID=32597 RepID=A0A7J6RAD1_PEROL|nr:hypothetical protein FOZ62_023781 [Perkinsus olseni]
MAYSSGGEPPLQNCSTHRLVSSAQRAYKALSFMDDAHRPEYYWPYPRSEPLQFADKELTLSVPLDKYNKIQEMIREHPIDMLSVNCDLIGILETVCRAGRRAHDCPHGSNCNSFC